MRFTSEKLFQTLQKNVLFIDKLNKKATFETDESESYANRSEWLFSLLLIKS